VNNKDIENKEEMDKEKSISNSDKDITKKRRHNNRRNKNSPKNDKDQMSQQEDTKSDQDKEAKENVSYNTESNIKTQKLLLWKSVSFLVKVLVVSMVCLSMV